MQRTATHLGCNPVASCSMHSPARCMAPRSLGPAPQHLASRFTGTQLSSTPVSSRRHARQSVVVEANLFGRFFRVISSYGNALVGSVEDPEKILDQAVNEMQGNLIKMRQASAQVLASQRQVEAKYESAQETADAWSKRAELAVRKGDDELAREALRRKQSYQVNADQMKKQLDQQVKATQQLIANTRQLESKLQEAKNKKDTLKARAKSANSAKQINEMVQGLNVNNAMTAFERMEEKVMALESESQATAQLAAPDDLETKFQQLEGNDVDNELAAMKKRSLSGSTAPQERAEKQLPEGRPIRDAIDFELEELRRKARE